MGTATIYSNEELMGIIKIIKSLEDSGSLIKSITKTVENEVKEQKGVFLEMLTSTLVTNL